ncbi:hypothetical protein BASA62_004581 [Batrachochytrium salamandrivorans]|nr:hypothetical protein BASA62_004581 [Batrachochytrium salamandrivorans]
MVNFAAWDDYQKAVHDLYLQAPLRTRYVVKYRHCVGKLTLKVTDGPKCLKFKTDKMQDLNKFDRLNRSMMAMMQKQSDRPREEQELLASGPPVAKKGGKATKKGKGKK